MKILFFLFITVFLQFNPVVENCKGSLQDGKKNGHWQCFYDDGTIQQEGDYTNDKKTGTWKFYHHNGLLALEGNFVDDMEKGRWKVFDDTGQPIDEIDYGS